ncbi:MAG: class I SAM-dependent methyltransferase, partial [Candidatus Hodarchaeales archaeon]
IGVRVSRNEAEEIRQILNKGKSLDNNKKIVNDSNYVYFPIIDALLLPPQLSQFKYKIIEFKFPNNVREKPITVKLKEEYPSMNWEEISTKFDQIGTIGLLRINKQELNTSIRKRVGEIIIETSPKIKTVINKIDSIEGNLRTYSFEHLAGKLNYCTWHREYGVLIKTDLKNTFFNPRLAEEHKRISENIVDNENILDLFTGVGPFALHCAYKKPCTVYAVDINAVAIQCLESSMKKNKLIGEINPIVGDSGRIFQKKGIFDRVIINLPEESINYLEYATKLINNVDGGKINLFQFIKKVDSPKDYIHTLISEKLKNISEYEFLRIQSGREVSPSRIQMNIDLRVSPY